MHCFSSRVTLAAALALATFFSAPAEAQVVIREAGVTLARDIDATAFGTVHGLDIHDDTRNVYFIGDTGSDLNRLAVDDTLTRISDDVGSFVGILSDLRVGPDGFIYVGDSTILPDAPIYRFRRTGELIDTFASVTIGTGSNAFGIDFDCAGNIVTGETGDNLYRIGTDRTVSTISTGWVDIDEVERFEDNRMFILDGSARAAERGTVFIQEPDGSVTRFAEDLPGAIYSGTFEAGSGDFIAADYTNGIMYRLTDANGNGTIEADERSVMVEGFGMNALADINYGRSARGPGYSIYAVASNHIYEFRGFDAPRFGGCGERFDDDGDGFCDLGVDLNGDGDCDDAGEDTMAMDCDDTEPLAAPDLTEMCGDAIDNDCDGDVDLDDEDCLTDTDMDGILDINEAPGDTDMDGMPDVNDPDDDGDGIPTATECPDPADCTNTDEDANPDYLDPDDDDDGIPTATEVADVMDLGGDPDDDGIPAYLDTDSDGEGGTDMEEGTGDADGDGVPDYLDNGFTPLDTDEDGIPDDVECPDGIADCDDTDMDGVPNYMDPDDDGDGIPTSNERPGATDQDTDGDDAPNHLDPDDDGDGVPTATECADPADCTNTDGDANDDYLDPDDDDDGIPTADEIADVAELGGDPDDDDVPAYLDTDSDGDGVLDADEGVEDSDDDGAPDYLDADSTPVDSDEDGIPDEVECPDGVDACDDTDEDGTPNHLDDDDDGDGVPTRDERPAGDRDTDGDGANDHLDPDDDGDGLPTADECTDASDCTDSDEDGFPDFLDNDDDDDGILTATEIEDEDALGGDLDGDGIPAYLDLDSDGDGAADEDEGEGDEDGDGAPDYLDEDTVPTDSDGDSVPDNVECPDGIDSCPDLDGDGVPNHMDPDDDGDGILTRDERPSGDADTDGDGRPNHYDDDDDGDGILSATENDAPEGSDVDGDGTPNYLDLDSDADGATDEVEGEGDDDGDGIPNYLDPSGDEPPVTGGAGFSGGAMCGVNMGASGDLAWLALLGAFLVTRRRRR